MWCNCAVLWSGTCGHGSTMVGICVGIALLLGLYAHRRTRRWRARLTDWRSLTLLWPCLRCSCSSIASGNDDSDLIRYHLLLIIGEWSMILVSANVPIHGLSEQLPCSILLSVGAELVNVLSMVSHDFFNSILIPYRALLLLALCRLWCRSLSRGVGRPGAILRLLWRLLASNLSVSCRDRLLGGSDILCRTVGRRTMSLWYICLHGRRLVRLWLSVWRSTGWAVRRSVCLSSSVRRIWRVVSGWTLRRRRRSCTVWHCGRRTIWCAIRTWSIRRVTLIAVGILRIGVAVVSIWILLSVLGNRAGCPPLLLFVDGKVRVDLPKTTLANLACFLKSLATNQIVTDTALPTLSWCTILVIRKHFLYGVVYLLQIHDACRTIRQSLVYKDDVCLLRLFELLFCVFRFWFLGRR